VLTLLPAFSANANAAETVDLGYKQDTGPSPFVFFVPETVDRAISFQATYNADPVQTLAVESYIHCTRGPESVSDKKQATITPPQSLTIPSTLSGADSCWITLSAEPPCCEGTGDPGTIRIEATALREPPPPPPTPEPAPPYWEQCTRPNWLVRGALRTHGDQLTCKRATRIATRAWRQPGRAGHFLRMGRWRCVRSGRRRRAVVHCVDGLERLQLTGKLRQGQSNAA